MSGKVLPFRRPAPKPAASTSPRPADVMRVYDRMGRDLARRVRLDAQSFRCPKCDAAPGLPCTALSGRRVEPHLERCDVAGAALRGMPEPGGAS